MNKNNSRLLKLGIGGSLIVALCCFTPILLILFGIVGLGRRRRQSRIAGGRRRDGAALQVLRMRRSGEQGCGERTAGQ